MSDPSGSRPEPRRQRLAPRLSDDPERSARREFQRRVLRAALIVDAVVVATLIVALLVWKLREILIIMLISLFLTLLLHPMVSIVERRGVRRALATGIVFSSCVIVVGGILFFILQPLVGSAGHLADQLPKIIRQAEHGRGDVGRFLARFHLTKYLTSKNGGAQSVISKLGKPALTVGKGVLSGVVGLVTIFFLTFFALIHAPRIYRGALSAMRPERAERIRLIVTDVERSVVGYVAGDVATSLIAGVIITITLLATGVPYAIVIGVWVAIVDFLPLVGGILAGVPAVIIALLHSVPAGLITLVVFLVYQEVENHVLYPIIMSRTVKLNSLWVLVSVIIGAELGDVVASVFGAFVGALLAVPAGSAVQVIARDIWEHRQGTLLVDVASPVGAHETEGTESLDTGMIVVAGEEPSIGTGAGLEAPDEPLTASTRARDRERRRRRRRPPGP